MRLNKTTDRGTSPAIGAGGAIRGPHEEARVPTLFRLLAVLAVLGGLGYAALWALANKVEPQEREIVFSVAPEKIGK